MYESEKMTKEQKLSQLMDGEWHQLSPAECVAAVCDDEALRAKWARYHIIRDAMNNEPVQVSQSLASRISAAIDDEPAYSNITPFSTIAESDANATSAPVLAASVTASSDTSSPEDGHGVVADIQKAKKKSSWVNSAIAGFAVAASVALVTVVGLNLFEQQSAPGVSAVASIDNRAQTGGSADNATFVQGDSATLPVVEFVANTGGYWVSPESSQRVSDEERLNMMLSQHIENSPTSSREGLLPYSRLVGYEENGQGR